MAGRGGRGHDPPWRRACVVLCLVMCGLASSNASEANDGGVRSLHAEEEALPPLRALPALGQPEGGAGGEADDPVVDAGGEDTDALENIDAEAGTDEADEAVDMGVDIVVPQSADTVKLNAALEDAVHEIHRLKAAHAAEQMNAMEKISAANTRMASYRSELNSTQFALRQTQEQAERLSTANKKLTSELNEAQSNIAELTVRSTALTEAKAQLASQLDSTKREYANVMAELEGIENDAATRSAAAVTMVLQARDRILTMPGLDDDVRFAVNRLADAARNAHLQAAKEVGSSESRLASTEATLQQERSSNVKIATQLTTVEAQNAHLTANKAVEVVQQNNTDVEIKLREDLRSCQDGAEEASSAAQKELAWYKEQLLQADSLKKVLRNKLASHTKDATTLESDSLAKSVLENTVQKADTMAGRVVRDFFKNMVSAGGRAKEIGDEVKAEHLAASVAANEVLRANNSRLEIKTETLKADLESARIEAHKARYTARRAVEATAAAHAARAGVAADSAMPSPLHTENGDVSKLSTNRLELLAEDAGSVMSLPFSSQDRTWAVEPGELGVEMNE